ncbi:MAG: diaminopimelate epimerase [bacterium]|nr:diaminopimelate epimerase [bacterium]
MKFVKMHGLGNDFVILDHRAISLVLSKDRIKLLCDRRLGIGCDQLILLEAPSTPKAQVRMRIFNADGHEVESCGNASRCVATLLAKELNQKEIIIETTPCLLKASLQEEGQVQVDMGKGTAEILDTSALRLPFKTSTAPIKVNVGNPHLVCLLKNITNIALEPLGNDLQSNALFPKGTNVELAQLVDTDHLKVRVFERGTGVTPACGTGACASALAAFTAGLTSKNVTVDLEGGRLHIEINPKTHHILMTGPTSLTFQGTLDTSLLAPSLAA